MSDESKLDEFQEKLMEERARVAAHYIETLSTAAEPPCKIFGQLLFKYDDGQNLLVNLAIVANTEEVQELHEEYLRLMRDNNA